MNFLSMYLALGIIVTILTYAYDGKELEINGFNIIIGIIFWPIGVLWFLGRLLLKICYELGI